MRGGDGRILMGWRCIFRGGRGEVQDDRAERFIMAEMNLGYSGCVEAGAHMYGKKASREEEKWKGVELSRGERGRWLCAMKKMWMSEFLG